MDKIFAFVFLVVGFISSGFGEVKPSEQPILLVAPHAAVVARLLFTGPPKVKISDCKLYSHREAINNIMQDTFNAETIAISYDEMRMIVDMCQTFQASRLDHPHFEAIFPGTKWCGTGSIAVSYDDLGEKTETDKCCRAHDHCDDNIVVGKTMHGITNRGIGTMSNCKCDDKFRSCLLATRDRFSNMIGRIYFNVLKPKCFKEEHPIIKCTSWSGAKNKECQDYELDYSKPKIYQLFDAQYYNAPSVENNIDWQSQSKE